MSTTVIFACQLAGEPELAYTRAAGKPSGSYIEPDQSVDFGAATVLELTLRPVDPDGALLAQPATEEEETLLEELDDVGGADQSGVA